MSNIIDMGTKNKFMEIASKIDNFTIHTRQSDNLKNQIVIEWLEMYVTLHL